MAETSFKYEALAGKIRTFIAGQDAGTMLPPEADMMRRFKASRNTLRNALAILRAKGMIESRAGRGTTIVSKAERFAAASQVMVIAPPHEYEYCAHILDGVNGVLQPAGFSMLYTSYFDDDIKTEIALMERASTSLLAGIIVITSHRSGEDPYLTTQRPRLPIVLIDNAVSGFAGPLVATDDERGAYDIVSRMIALGHRRIAYLGGFDTLSQRTRKAGYLRAMNENNLDIEAHNNVGFSNERGYAFGKEYLDTKTLRPTAFFAVNDGVALGFSRAARERGYAAPGCISIAGYGNLVREMGAAGFKVTTMVQDGNAVGRTAAEKILELIGMPQHILREETILLPVSFVDNGSIAAPQ